MGGSGSKELSFSDFESIEKNNSKSNKSKSQQNTQGSKSKSKSQSNQQEKTESKKDSSKNKNNTQSSLQKEITEKSEKEEDEQNSEQDEQSEENNEEKNEETSQKKSSGKKSSEKKSSEKKEETSNKEENEDEEKSEENSGKKSTDKKSSNKKSDKKENKVASESKEEDKNGEMFREGDDFTQEDADISDINSYIENNKKRKLKSQKLNVPRQELNGEKYLEGDIEYKKINNLKSIKEENDEEDKSQQSGEQLDEVEQLKKQKMLKEYDFYLTKEIPKTKFVNKNKISNLPMDYASTDVKKSNVKTYLCFVEAKTNKKKRVEIKPNENQLIKDEVYLFKERQKQIKSIKPLTKEEHLQPFSYKIEFEMDKKGISNKLENKLANNNHDYIDLYPNGEAFKYLSNEDEEENKKIIKNKVVDNKEALDKAQIEEIKKNDENDIVNIINKGLQENNLVEKENKGDNANDF